MRGLSKMFTDVGFPSLLDTEEGKNEPLIHQCSVYLGHERGLHKSNQATADMLSVGDARHRKYRSLGYFGIMGDASTPPALNH